MKFVKLSDNQYVNLDRVDYIVADPDNKDCVVYFNDDNKLYLDDDQASILLKVVDEISAVNLG